MVTTASAVTSTLQTVELHVSPILPLYITHLKQITTKVGAMANLEMVTTILKITTDKQ
jgi:hypothetical protein